MNTLEEMMQKQIDDMQAEYSEKVLHLENRCYELAAFIMDKKLWGEFEVWISVRKESQKEKGKK